MVVSLEFLGDGTGVGEFVIGGVAEADRKSLAWRWHEADDRG